MSDLESRGLAALVAELLAQLGRDPDVPVRVEEVVVDGRRTVRAEIPGVDPRQHLERLLRLPLEASAEDVRAEYADGVLTVSMPAQASSVPTRIPVTHRELPVE